MTPRIKAHLALLIVALIYSGNYIIAKGLMPDYIQPRAFIFMRVVGATSLFFLLTWITKNKQKIERADWLRVGLCGFFGVASNQILFFEGLNLTTPINASVIMTANPVLVLGIGALLLQEKLKPQKILGVFVGAAGAIFLILSSAQTDFTLPGISVGNLLIFLNAASYAVYLVIVKPLMKKYDALVIIKWVFASGLLFVVPAGIVPFTEIDWPSWTSSTFGAAAFVVICTTFLAYLLNVFALKTLSSSTVSTYIYLQPLFTTFIALFFARDKLTAEAIIAALFIFIGVYMVGNKSRAPKFE
jgi:drug/metabolite transporter (DMT)-like permease